jgi:hypothetical protein
MVPVTVSVLEQRLQTQCKLERVTHEVTRYPFMLRARFVPVQYEQIDIAELVEAAAVCMAVPKAENAGRSVNRIEATMYLAR